MKSKFFILTLMMMFCSMAFGQTESHAYWGDFNPRHYANSMQLLAALEADDVNVPAPLQIAAFCGEERRSYVVTPTQMSNGEYLVQLQIYGGKSYNVETGDEQSNGSFTEDQYPIVVKIYDGTSDYELTSFNFKANQVMGDLTNHQSFTFNYVAKIGETNYATLQAAIDNVDEGETITIFESIEEGTITLPQYLKNVTVTASDKVVVTNTVITTPALGNAMNFTIDYDGLTFNEVNFKNSRMYFQGWANDALYQEVSIKNIAVTYCNFNDIDNPTDKNLAAVHFNVNKNELVNLTFTDNKIDVITGGESSGLYGDFTGNVTITGNNIKNTSGSSMVIGYNNANITISGNVLENWGTSGNGRAIRLSENDATDASTVNVTKNAMICTNAPEEFVKATESNTTITLSENYWSGKSPREEEIVNAEGAVIKNYYQKYENNTLSDLFWFPYGTITIGYTNTDKIWGEGTSNSTKSFVVKLYADETLLGQSSLNNINNIIDGEVYVTWSIPFNPTNTGYWKTEWYQELTPSVQPTTVKLYADGELVAENVVQMNAPDNLNPIQWNDIFVAKIGDKYYTSLQAAIDAANADLPITLIKDITLESDLANAAKGYFNVSADDKITIDLNGKKITATDNSTGNFILFYNYGELTFTDSQNSAVVELTATNNREWNAQSTIVLNRGGVLTISGGQFIHKGGSDMAITICNSANSFGDAYMYVNGGEIISEIYIAIRMRMADPSLNGNPGNGVSNLEIIDGTIEGYSRAIWGQITNASSEQLGNLTITGGIIKGTNADNKKAIEMATDTHDNINVTISGAELIDGSLIGDASDYAISGGTFTVPVPEEYCAEGYIPTANNDGTYGVKPGSYVAQIGETKYETIADAIAAAQPGQTVTILAGKYGNYETNNYTTININKPEITVEGEIIDGYYNTIIYGRLNITADNVTVKNLYVFYGSNTAVYINAKDVIVEGCDISGSNGLYQSYTTGNVTFKDSYIGGGTYGIHFDGSANGNIVIDNCEVVGWTSFASTITNVAISNTTFSNGDYNQLRFYQNAQLTDCQFNENMTIDFGKDDVDAAFENCVIIDADGNKTDAPLTDVIYLGDIVEMGVDIKINGEPVVVEAKVTNGTDTDYYLALEDAIAAADGKVVTVLANVELENTITIAAGKVVTLDLNGNVVSGISNTAGTTAVIINKGNLTVQTSVEGGKITTQALQPDTNWGGEGEPQFPSYANNTIRNEGVFTLTSGMIENTSAAGGATYAIDNYNGSTTNINGGKVYCQNNIAIRLFCGNNITLNVNGGEVKGTRALWIQLASSSSAADAPNVKVNITDGTLTATGENGGYVQAIYSYSHGNDMQNVEINISGGTFNGDINLTGGSNKTNIETLNISGGTFNGNEYCVNSYGEDEKAVEAITITGGTFLYDYAEIYSLDDGFVFVYDETTQMYGLQAFSDLEISNLDELIAFRNAVNAGNTFADKIVKVTADIDMETIENWTPIGTSEHPFKGTFDGGNFTISNLNAVGEANVGLFGYADNATIKNIKLENVNVKGTDCVGAIAGQVYSTSLIDNCHVSGSIEVEGQTNVGGIVGKYYTKVTNSSVIGDGVAASYVIGVYKEENLEGDNIGGIMGHGGENNTFTNNTVKNITISGTRKVGGIVGVTDQNTDVTNCVVENVNIETTAEADYAEANKTKAGHGSIVGSYTKLGANNNGTVTNCVVKNVIFVNNDNVTMSAGPITGGAREGMVDPTGVTASGNLIYMSTITGNTTNMYLMNAVAKIDETKYYTLFDAVAAAQGETTTITLINDASEVFAINNTTTAITLDLNGKKLTGSIAPSKANLTVKNGTIESVDPEYSAIEINEGVLTLNNVNITSQRHAVRIDGDVIATIDGGTYKPTATSGTRHAVNVSGGANVTIKDGTFMGPKGTTMDSGSAVCVQAGATVTIEGGDFSGGKNATLGVSGTMIVKGGTFDQDPSAYVAPGYACEQLEANKYIVKISSTEIFYTAEGVETTADQAAYSLIFTITNAEKQEVSLEIGSKEPTASSDIHLITPTTATINDVVYNVTSVAKQGLKGTNFTKITISEGVTSLAYESLTNTQRLTDLVLPRTLGHIENAVFNGTEGQYAIKTVTILAETAPTAAAHTSIPKWMSSKVLVVKNGKYQDYSTAMAWSRFGNIIAVGSTKEIAGKDNKYTMIATITSMDPMECSIKIGQKPAANSMAELVIPETVDFAEHLTGYEFNAIKVTEIEENAFISTLYFVGNFTVPQYVRTIGTSAFNTCFYVSNPDLRGTLTLNEGLLSIGSQAFKNAYFKGDLSIPASVENIVANAFQLAQFDGTLTINSNVNYQQAFNGSVFTKLVIAEGVEEVTSNYAFAGMKSLKEVVIPLTLDKLGQGAFYDVQSIESVMTYATEVPEILYNNNNTTLAHPFHAEVKANATLWVVGQSYDDVLKYKADAKWNEFANIHLYGAVAAVEGEDFYCEYLNFAEAYENAADKTLVLLADVELEERLTVDKNITLNLNGHNINAPFTDSYGAIYVKKGAVLTIDGEGNITSNSLAIGTYGTVNINGGNITTTGSEDAALYVFYYEKDYEGTANIYGGSLNTVWNCGILNVSGGKIDYLDTSSELTVEGGSITDMYARDGSDASGEYVMNIANLDLFVNPVQVPEGYEFKEVSENVYKVVLAQVTQTTQLGKGWNWFSTYVETDFVSMKTAMATNVDQIKNQTESAQYESALSWWFGEITPSAEKMYLMNVNTSFSMELSGKLYDYENIELTLQPKWTWIGYPLSTPMAMSTAIDIEPADGDMIKTLSGDNATYVKDLGMWFGDFNMTPGTGYMYYSNASEPIKFRYPNNSKDVTLVETLDVEKYWNVEVGKYPHNMSVIAMLNVDGKVAKDNYEIAAFVNGELRGSARPIYVEALDIYVYILSIVGNDVEEMTFKCYDILTGEELLLDNTMNYSNDAIVGSVTEPYMFTRGTNSIGENSAENFNIYPNPTTTNAEINLNANCDKVEVYNALGVKVAEYSNVDTIDALETAGIYVIRITDNNNVKHCRLIVR